jgi:hypothetical protein
VDTMTDKSVEIVEGLVMRAPANGRRTYSETAKRALVQLSCPARQAVTGVGATMLMRYRTNILITDQAHITTAVRTPSDLFNRKGLWHFDDAVKGRWPVSTCIPYSRRQRPLPFNRAPISRTCSSTYPMSRPSRTMI